MPMGFGLDPGLSGITFNEMQQGPTLPTSPAEQSAAQNPIVNMAPPPLYPSTPQGPRLQMPQGGPQILNPAMDANVGAVSTVDGHDVRQGYGVNSAVPYTGGPVQQGGMVRALMDAGSGRSAYGDVMLPADQVNQRRGMSWAELTANNPTLGTSELAQLRQRMIGANQGLELQNMQLANETNNRLRGVMGNTDAIALGRNQIEAERVANEQWGRTPAGRQAMAENSAFQAFLNQPQGPTSRPLGDFVRSLQQAQTGGLFGTGTGHTSPIAPTPSVQMIDETRPPQMGAGPQTPVAPAGGYAPGPQASIYGPHEEMLNALRARSIAAGENGVGGFLSSLDRNQPGFIGGNFPAVEAFLRDRYGNSAFQDASAGVSASPLGGIVTPMNPNAGFMDNIGRMLSQAVSPISPFNRQMNEEQSGRAMLANLLASRRR